METIDEADVWKVITSRAEGPALGETVSGHAPVYSIFYKSLRGKTRVTGLNWWHFAG